MVSAFLISVALGPAAQGGQTKAGPASQLDPQCAFSKDAAENASRISEQSVGLEGRCVNTSRYRPVVDLQVDERNNKMTFKNYVYRGGFWTATIPTDAGAFSDAIFVIKRFTVNAVQAAHTQLRFRMSPDHLISLVNQETGETAVTDDLALTYEAGLVQGVGFNIVKAVMPVNPLVGRAGDTLSILSESPKPMEQYVLNLTDEEKVTVVVNGLRRSSDIGLRTWYNTIRPNCTTEVFDLLDSLPRLKGKMERFVVSASLDPVAGPSLQALQSRGLIVKRVQNVEDEVKGVRAVLRIPETTAKMPDFIPSVANFPWSLVLVGPQLSTLNESERAAIAGLKRDLLVHMFRVLAGYLGAKLAEDRVEDRTDNKVLADVFGKYKDALPKEDRLIGVYFAPYAGVPASTSLVKYGLDVSVPFPVIEENYNAASRGQLRAFREIYNGDLKVAEKGQMSDVPAYLLSIGLTVHARKNASFATIQTMVGLNDKAQAMEKPDKQVNIHRFEIPDVTNVQNIPAAVMTAIVPLPLPADDRPTLLMQFGPIGKIVDRDDLNKTPGMLQVRSPVRGTPEARGRSERDLCVQRTISTPFLVGNLTREASGIGIVDKVLAGSKIFFKILSVTVDLKAMKVSDLEVRSDVPPLKCLSLEQVNDQFQVEANKNIAAFKKKVIEFVEKPFIELSQAIGN